MTVDAFNFLQYSEKVSFNRGYSFIYVQLVFNKCLTILIYLGKFVGTVTQHNLKIIPAQCDVVRWVVAVDECKKK